MKLPWPTFNVTFTLYVLSNVAVDDLTFLKIVDKATSALV